MTVTVNLGDISREFDRLAQAVAPARLLPAVGEVGERYVRRPFARGTNPKGVPWKPLARAYDQRGQFAGILVRTGRLRDAYRGWRLSGNAVVWGENAPEYGAYHNTGTARLPRRQYLPEGELHPQWLADTIEAMRERVVEDVQ